MRCGWRAGLLLLVGCGPAVTSGGTGGSTGEHIASTSGPDATSTSATATTTASSEISTGSGNSSSSSGGPPLELTELQGPIHYCADCYNPMSYLRPCDFEEDWLCMIGNDDALLRCNGTYARVRGYLIPNPGYGALDEPCGEHLFEIAEVIESRLCETADCGAGCSEGFDCATTCWGDETCAESETCKPWGLPPDSYGARRCVPAGDVPVGGACSNDPELWRVDDCQAGALCFGGTCQALCAEDGGDDCAEGHCFYGGATTICLPACNPLAPDCEEGESCTASAGSFACLDQAQAGVFVHSDCAGTTCGPLEMCLDAESVPGCSEDACCSPLCDSTTPDCADGLACVDLWPDDEYPELANLGVCASPGA